MVHADSIADFVAASGGTAVIKRVLVANNGIAAVKLIRSIRRWSFETFQDEHAIEIITMATPEDLEANSEYIHMSDQIVNVPGGTNGNNFASVEVILGVVQRVHADVF